MEENIEIQTDNAPQADAPTPSKKGLFPTFADLAAVFGVFILAQLLGFFLARIFLSVAAWELSYQLEQAWLMLLMQCVSMPLVILFIALLRRSRHAEKVRVHFSVLGFNPSVLLGGVVMMLSASVVLEPLIALLPAMPAIEARGWPLLVALVVAAPIFEEYICRGLIYGAVRAKWSIVVGLVVSSLFFGLMHLHPSMIVNAFFMGLILGYIYIRTRSLFAPILLHAFNNGLAYIFLLLGWGNDVLLGDMIPNRTFYYIIYGLSIIALLVSVVLSWRLFSQLVESQSGAVEEIIEDEE
ncbi:MAG: type II CAAX endopeptidase family protein [Rikenellaceae bacterium]